MQCFSWFRGLLIYQILRIINSIWVHSVRISWFGDYASSGDFPELSTYMIFTKLVEGRSCRFPKTVTWEHQTSVGQHRMGSQNPIEAFWKKLGCHRFRFCLTYRWVYEYEFVNLHNMSTIRVFGGFYPIHPHSLSIPVWYSVEPTTFNRRDGTNDNHPKTWWGCHEVAPALRPGFGPTTPPFFGGKKGTGTDKFRRICNVGMFYAMVFI